MERGGRGGPATWCAPVHILVVSGEGSPGGPRFALSWLLTGLGELEAPCYPAPAPASSADGGRPRGGRGMVDFLPLPAPASALLAPVTPRVFLLALVPIPVIKGRREG